MNRELLQEIKELEAEIVTLRGENDECGQKGRSAVDDLTEKAEFWKQKYLDLKKSILNGKR